MNTPISFRGGDAGDLAYGEKNKSFKDSFDIAAGVTSHLLLKECTEIRSIGEAESIRDFLNVLLSILQQRDTFTDNRLEYKFLYCIPAYTF